MNRKLAKLLPILMIMICVFVIYHYFLYEITEALYYYFVMMGHYSVILFSDGEMAYGAICLLLQIIAWLIFVFIIKITIFNALFPKIRIVDPLKNSIAYARKIKAYYGEDPRFIYFKIKFKFFPVFRWHNLKIPKPETTHKGIIGFRKKVNVENGQPGVLWRRMPSSLDIVTDSLNIEWNESEETYQITPEFLTRIEEPVDNMRGKTSDTIKRLSQNVNESVRGDAMLLKDQYQTGIPISMEVSGLSSSTSPAGLSREPRMDAKKEIDINKEIEEEDDDGPKEQEPALKLEEIVDEPVEEVFREEVFIPSRPVFMNKYPDEDPTVVETSAEKPKKKRRKKRKKNVRTGKSVSAV